MRNLDSRLQKIEKSHYSTKGVMCVADNSEGNFLFNGKEVTISPKASVNGKEIKIVNDETPMEAVDRYCNEKNLIPSLIIHVGSITEQTWKSKFKTKNDFEN